MKSVLLLCLIFNVILWAEELSQIGQLRTLDSLRIKLSTKRSGSEWFEIDGESLDADKAYKNYGEYGGSALSIKYGSDREKKRAMPLLVILPIGQEILHEAKEIEALAYNAYQMGLIQHLGLPPELYKKSDSVYLQNYSHYLLESLFLTNRLLLHECIPNADKCTNHPFTSAYYVGRLDFGRFANSSLQKQFKRNAKR